VLLDPLPMLGCLDTSALQSLAELNSGMSLPWKTKLTLKKYVPIGRVIMAKVKLINFQMTELW
jgi:hypothetical protein